MGDDDCDKFYWKTVAESIGIGFRGMGETVSALRAFKVRVQNMVIRKSKSGLAC